MSNQRRIVTALIFLAIVVATSATVPEAEAFTVVDYVTCYGYRLDTYAPKGTSAAFLSTSEKVGLWVKINDPPSVADIRVIWTDPDGRQYDSNAAQVTKLEGEDWGIIFDFIYIAGYQAADKTGKWTVEMTIDHQKEVGLEFQIIDYLDLVSDIAQIREDVLAIVEEKNALQTQYQDLIKQYADLQDDYDELKANPTGSAALEDLQDQYDEIYENYRDMQVNLSTTKMMMYGAVVVAVASVAVAVYFGAIKKS